MSRNSPLKRVHEVSFSLNAPINFFIRDNCPAWCSQESTTFQLSCLLQKYWRPYVFVMVSLTYIRYLISHKLSLQCLRCERRRSVGTNCKHTSRKIFTLIIMTNSCSWNRYFDCVIKLFCLRQVNFLAILIQEFVPKLD